MTDSLLATASPVELSTNLNPATPSVPHAAVGLASRSFADLLTPASKSASLLFIDRSVRDYQTLIDAANPDIELHLLNANQDAIAQITQVLSGRSNIASLHIVSHGEVGQVEFGNSVLNASTISTYSAQLQSWSTALTQNADILLYGCDIAQGETGQALVQMLSQLTRADVAASTDVTGKAGNWTLEFHQGAIAATLPFNANALSAYQYNLYGIDFDNNGTRDLVLYNYQTGQAQLQLMNGTTTLNTINLGSGGPGWQVSGVGDFDGNGYTDLVWQNRGTGDVGLWLMNGTGLAGTIALPNVGAGSDWQIVGVKDFNGNGTPDLLWRSNAAATTALWLMNGTTVAGYQILPSLSSSWGMSGIADINNDGSNDILWRNRQTGENQFWVMNGINYASTIALPSIPLNWVPQELGDWNNDGMTDIFWRDSTTGQAKIWTLNNGSFASSVNVALPGNASWTIVGSRDFDGNGTPDLIVRNYLSGENAFWMMSGSTYTNTVASDIMSGYWDIIAA